MEQKVHIPCTGIKGANHIELDVHYEKGDAWMNLYNRRGYYLSIRPIEITPMHCADGDFDMISFGGAERGSKTYFLEGTERKSAKRLNEFAEKVKAHAQEIADAFVRQDYNAVWAYV